MTTMLRLTGTIALPPHIGKGGFDHAAVHAQTGHVYVAHTANDAIDVIDPAVGKRIFSIPGLPGVAGALVCEEWQLIITSNRAENTIGIFAPGPQPAVAKVPVGVGPNGLACDPERRLILVANVGDPAVAGSHTLSMVALDERKVLAEIPVPSRTRWAVYDADAETFYVNIAEPSQIAVVASRDPRRIARTIAIPSVGAHGLDLDLATHRLFCACDGKILVTLDAASGKVLAQNELSGVPDVVFFNPARKHLYVAVGDPGVIDVFDTVTMQRLGSVPSEKGAHTLAFPPAGDGVYAFLPQTHRAAVYQESEI
jgi:DNA-binding beta-propeller fold protein YncE